MESSEPRQPAASGGDVRAGVFPPAGRRLWVEAALVTAVCALPLQQLFRLSLKSELHSHLLLIPLMSWYVCRFIDGRGAAERGSGRPEAGFTAGCALLALMGAGFLAGYWWLHQGARLPVTEYLWTGILGYLLLLLVVVVRWRGWQPIRGHAFAVALLLFFLPLPLAVTDGLSMFLQRGSAEVADVMLRMTGLPVLRDGMMFQLPGLIIRVAEECSGVRSTLVLFITSLMAGKMFLRAGWKRLVLALATVPLGLLRNAFRITVLSWLSVHVDPGVIHGPLHHQGGPVFFVLSLIPLFGLLWYFRRSESVRQQAVK